MADQYSSVEISAFGSDIPYVVLSALGNQILLCCIVCSWQPNNLLMLSCWLFAVKYPSYTELSALGSKVPFLCLVVCSWQPNTLMSCLLLAAQYSYVEMSALERWYAVLSALGRWYVVLSALGKWYVVLSTLGSLEIILW